MKEENEVADPDHDLHHMNEEQLLQEIKRLRAAIRAHRDATGHDLCWFHPELWSLLPEQKNSPIQVPDWPQFMEGCVIYRQSLDEKPD
ncbi:hypothetical protein C7434_1190 [Pantoea sp. PNA 14-12]|uniref:hypothetical protein n=1 Tax=Pantoea TaxID=53335 RepID=UPI00050EB43A|nr:MULTISPECIES: hypothetical protein [Pantoea]KGD81024.1 hypothetical protein HA47_18910 [Pantoea stewartii subsp. indologenes]MDF7785038.1 hypothetical protein [Pantoea stewartii]TDS72377.1 hypothetical protein C7434_1190 [Pantoea sp. PNA 14-12]